MAQIPYTGTQDVLPDTRVPDDYSRVQANPSEAGGAIAQGLQKLGAGATDVSKFFGETAVNDTWNHVNDEATKLLHGDPNKTTIGPDGQPQPDLGFYGLKGRAALDARPAVEQQLDQLISSAQSNLTTPAQKLQFDQISRRYRSYWSSDIGTAADKQANAWYADVNARDAKQNLDGISRSADDPEKVANFTSDLINARVKDAQLAGGGPDLVQAAIAQGKREAATAQIESIAVKNPARAQRMVENYKNILGTEYAPLAEHIRIRADQQTGFDAAHQEVVSARTGLPVSPDSFIRSSTAAPGGFSPAGLIRAANIESGGDPGAGAGTAHIGLMQFSGETWRQYGQGSPTDPNAAIDAAARYSAANAPVLARSLGRQPTDGELYIAHQQGPGGAVKLLTNPNVRAGDLVGDAAIRQNGGDPNAPASAFTNRWLTTFSGTPTTIAPQALRADVYTRLENNPALQNNPQARNYAYAEADRVLKNQEIADNQTERAQKEASDQAAGGYVTKMWDMINSPKPDFVQLAGQINHDPNLDWKTKQDLMERVKRVSGEEQSLTFGPGYREAREALFSDPDAPGHADSVAQFANRDDITMAGLEDLSRRFGLAKKSPDRMANEKIINSFLKDAQQQMVHDQDLGLMKIADAKGGHLYNAEFVPKFVKQAARLQEEAEKTGDSTKLDKYLSRDNVDKMVNEIYPLSQRNQDRISANLGGDAPPPAPPPAGLPSAPANVNPDAWTKIVSAPPVTAEGGYSASSWGKALNILLADPAKNVSFFNAKFPGQDGSQIIQQLTGRKPPTDQGAPVVQASFTPKTNGLATSVATPSAAAPPPPAVPATNLAAAETRRGAIGAAPPPSAEEIRAGEAEIAAYRAAHPPAVRAVPAGPAAAHPGSMTPEAHRRIDSITTEKQRRDRLDELDREEAEIKSRDFLSREMKARLDLIASERARLK